MKSFLYSAFPQVNIATRSEYEELKISNIKDQTDHSMQLKYEKSSWIIVDHQLPTSSFESKSSTNLLDSVRNYTLMLDNLQPFYDSLQTLDEICIVGEPAVITPKTNWRLVKFSNKTFIKIEFINPFCVDEISVTFHGCTNIVKEMTEMYNLKSGDYDGETIYHKLLSIFDIPYFPATDEEFVDCSICLCYRDESDRCPIVRCDNEKCDSTFHISCLEKYLSIKNHVRILSICIGECPFCKQTLSNSYAPFFQNINETDKNENLLE